MDISNYKLNKKVKSLILRGGGWYIIRVVLVNWYLCKKGVKILKMVTEMSEVHHICKNSQDLDDLGRKRGEIMYSYKI